ncbi:hypothetical protein [Herpetosiphon sp. NSE202]|uniref:hypothetical protein n=1 Tax=Herpetosiphon sp. NSE202 TaxID=3351349 RepID=UPI003633B16E
MFNRSIRPHPRQIVTRLIGGLVMLVLIILPLTTTTARPIVPAPDRMSTTWSGPPPIGSKNATQQPATDPAGITKSGPALPGTKNYSPPEPTANRAIPTDEAAGWRFTACGSIQDGGWTTTSAAFAVIRSCSLTFSEPGFVYLAASTSIGVATGGNVELRLNLNIDSTSGNTNTDRWINVYTDATDGTDKNAAVTMLAPVSAGTHTFYFLGARYNGDGTVQLYDPSLSVLYFPNSSSDVLACGESGNLVWNTAETSFQAIRSCALNVPQAGFVYLSGTSSAGLASGGASYEGRFRLGVDSVTGTASTDRWVNVTTDAGDGTDEAMVTSLLTSVDAGEHTFYLSGARYNGTGPVQLYDPALTALYFPAPNVTLKVCGAGGSDTWTNNTTSYSIIRSCTLNVPRDGFAFVDASASAGLNDTAAGNDWEGQFRLGIDNDTGTSITDRWLNVYTDATDGTDRPVSNMALFNINKGVHTFYFVGRRYAGAGTLRLYSPSLSVLVPGERVFLPLVIK